MEEIVVKSSNPESIQSSDKTEQKENKITAEYKLQKLTDIHLHSNLLQESEPDEQGDATAVSILSIIALSVLVIAWVNYINLSSSRALERAREVGVRKVVGAHRRQLIRQFLAEALVMNLVAAVISILIVALVLPFFNNLTGRHLSMTLFTETLFWAGLSVLFLVGALLSQFSDTSLWMFDNDNKILKWKCEFLGMSS
jgi:putative ABC transport system permease protein